MKKFLSVLLAVALMLSNWLTLRASATGIDLTERDQFIALAKGTFPEFADKLDGANTPRITEPQAIHSEVNVVVQQTRAVDRNTTMTYTEYDNGMVTLGVARFVKNAYITVEDSVTHSTYEEFTATIVAYVVEGPTFTATNVKYRIYPTNYDQIISAGNYSIPGYTNDDIKCFLRRNETASQFACASYSFICPIGTVYYSGKVIFKLQGNVASVEFDIW